MRKKLLIVVVAAAAISLLFAACFVEFDPTDIPEGGPMVKDETPINGDPVTKTAAGYGGEVKVTFALKDGHIVDLEIDVSKQTEPSLFAEPMKKQITPMIIQANSFDIDATCGASYTAPAVKIAGNQALYEITGGEYGSEDGSKRQ